MKELQLQCQLLGTGFQCQLLGTGCVCAARKGTVAQYWQQRLESWLAALTVGQGVPDLTGFGGEGKKRGQRGVGNSIHH